MGLAAWSRRGKLLLLGALSFWLPDVFVHAGARFDLSDVARLPIVALGIFVISLGMPLCLLVAWARAKRSYGGRVGPWMLLGVWLLGGFFMQVSASFSDGGFASAQSLREIALLNLMSVLPPVTFMMATYDGSLFALMLVTVSAAVIWIVQVSRSRALGPAQGGAPR